MRTVLYFLARRLNSSQMPNWMNKGATEAPREIADPVNGNMLLAPQVSCEWEIGGTKPTEWFYRRGSLEDKKWNISF